MPSIKFDSVYEMIAFLDLVNDGRKGDMNINFNGVPPSPGADDAHDQPAGQDRVIITNYDNIQDGDRIRWEGRSIQADGTVVGDAERDDDDDIVVRFRRDDNGKTVKLTFNDEPTFGTMYQL